MLINPGSIMAIVTQPRGAVVPAPVTQSWSVGQLLNALVVASPARGPALIEVAGQTLSARANTELTTGDVLKLRVLTTRQPPELQILEHTPRAAIMVRDALRVALPRQSNFSPLMKTLQTLIGSDIPAKSPAALPQPLVELAKAVVASMVRPAELGDPRRLQQSIERSGVLLEAFLRSQVKRPPGSSIPTAAARLADDLKANLARLGRAVANQVLIADQAVPVNRDPRAVQRGDRQSQTLAVLGQQADEFAALAKLHKQVEGSLHRIALNQLRVLQSEDTARNTLHVDLPVRSGELVDTVSLRIRRDQAASADTDTTPMWCVNLRMDPPGLGRIDARVTVRGGTVTATFWAASGDTGELIAAHADELRGALTEAGLAPGQIALRPGPVPNRDVQRLTGQLLAERA